MNADAFTAARAEARESFRYELARAVAFDAAWADYVRTLDRIHALRLARNVTDEQFRRYVGCCILDVVKGRRTLRVRQLPGIAFVLRVHPSTLLDPTLTPDQLEATHASLPADPAVLRYRIVDSLDARLRRYGVNRQQADALVGVDIDRVLRSGAGTEHEGLHTTVMRLLCVTRGLELDLAKIIATPRADEPVTDEITTTRLM